MKFKIVSIILILVFLSITLVAANPIPVPILLMPMEYIDVHITFDDEILWAKVKGMYPFTYIHVPPFPTYDNVTMYYPITPDAEDISVKMNETSLSWAYNGTKYPTVIGDFPLIYWIIKPVPDKFNVSTYYEHPVPKIGGDYMFLYAMGTGRYLEYYAKNTTAYVTFSVSKNVAPNEEYIDVYTIGYNATTREWTWKPASYTIIQQNGIWIITLIAVSEMFHPLEEDLLLTIRAFPRGGKTVPIDIPIHKFDLLAPYIGLASTMLVAIVATAIYVKRVKHRKRKQ